MLLYKFVCLELTVVLMKDKIMGELYKQSNLEKENHSLLFIKLYALQLIYTLFEELMEKLSMCSGSY